MLQDTVVHIKYILTVHSASNFNETYLRDVNKFEGPTSTDSSGGSKLKARSKRARTFLSSFKRHKKSAYLNLTVTIHLIFSVSKRETLKKEYASYRD